MQCRLLVHSTQYTVGAQASALIVFTLDGRVNALTVYNIGAQMGSLTVYTLTAHRDAFLVPSTVYSVNARVPALHL